MTFRTLIGRSLRYYWRTNLAVVLGVATAVAVLAGALIVGDSVRASLRDLFLSRSGHADYAVFSPTFFREALASELASDPDFSRSFGASAPLILLEAVVTHESSRRRAGAVQVYGVDQRFWAFHGLPPDAAPRNREALLSASLARELGAAAGDGILVRVPKPSDVPAETLYGRKDDLGRTVRLTVRATLPAGGIGEFSLRPVQGDVRVVFVPLARVQRDLQQESRANAILVSAKDAREVREAREVKEAKEAKEEEGETAVLQAALRRSFALEDIGLRIRTVGASRASEARTVPEAAGPRGQGVGIRTPNPESLIPTGAAAATGADADTLLSVESTTALVTDRVAAVVAEAGRELGLQPHSVFTYLANSIRSRDRQIPYSLVTAIDLGLILPPSGNPSSLLSNSTGSDTDEKKGSSPIVLNEWAARDLGARIGDPISLDYFIWQDEGRLATRTAEFHLAAIVPIAGAAADRDLAPDYPGISGAESLSDWDPPFPIDLDRIRKKDEDYWHEYRTTPKAFIPEETGRTLWETRYGSRTAVRLMPAAREPGSSPAPSLAGTLTDRLRAALDPLESGIAVTAVKAQGLAASRGATDFGEYFTYFSFFLVFSALLLTVLFFKLSIEQRLREIGLLRAVGFPHARVRRQFLLEGLVLAACGALLGAAAAAGYGWLMLFGLRTWWVGAVGTTALTLHVSAPPLITGVAGGLIASIVCIAWSLRHVAPASPRSLVTGAFDLSQIEAAGSTFAFDRVRRLRFAGRGVVFTVFCCAGLAILAAAVAGLIGEIAGFFGSGMLLLVAFLAGLSMWLRRPGGTTAHGRGRWSVANLGLRQAAIRPARSVLSMALIASATFIIVAVEVFRGGRADTAGDRRSGSGGFALMAESLLPLFHDLNAAEGREALNLPADMASVRFFRFRLRPGDDASCLNLYAPSDPRIVAPEPAFVARGGFTFQEFGIRDSGGLSANAEETANPWLLLDRHFLNNIIPVIADANSAAYVLHLKLGDDFLLPVRPTPDATVKPRDDAGVWPVRLRLVGTLSRSVFQSELIMSEQNFQRLFPEHQGHRLFMMESPAGREANVSQQLESALSDVGLDVASTADRLASYHRVENTYLSTFQMLGGLGLVLGTIGLSTVLLRNVLERRRELALLRAVGYNSRHLTLMVIAENALLLFGGLGAGTSCALIAIAPAFLSHGGRVPTLPLGLLAAVIATGFAASLAATAVVVRLPLIASLRSE